jgi:hypothetical protein
MNSSRKIIHTAAATPPIQQFHLQYASNLYITRHEKPLFPLFLKPTAPYLALVGNVGHPLSDYYSSFFTWAAARWKSIIYIPGEVEQSITNTTYEILKHHQNVCILTSQNPFYIYEPYKLAMWTPTEQTAYRKLFVFTYNCQEQRTFLEHHGTIYSHGINGTNGKIHTNSRGYEESPADGFQTNAILKISLK